MHQFDLSNETIKISTRLNAHYAFDVLVERVITKDLSIEYRLSQGYSVDIFLCLQFILNFTYMINPKVDIYDLANSSNYDVDLYLASFSLYEKRALYADPTYTTGYSEVMALVNHDFEDISTDVFLTTFSVKLLCAINFMVLTFLSTLGFLSKYEGVSLVDAQVHGLAIILRQEGFKKLSKNISSRIVLLILSVFLMILSASFTGNMVSISAIHEHGIQSVDDVVNSECDILLELGAPNSTIRLMLEQMSQMPIVKAMMSRILKSEQLHKYKEIATYIDLVRNSPTVYIMDLESIIAEVDKKVGYMPCTWSLIPVFNLWYPWAMFMKKKSPYKPAINYGIVRLRETGMMKRIRDRWLPRPRKCKEEGHTFKSLRFSQVHSGFLCLFIGCFVSICLIITEYIVKLNRMWLIKVRRFDFLS